MVDDCCSVPGSLGYCGLEDYVACCSSVIMVDCWERSFVLRVSATLLRHLFFSTNLHASAGSLLRNLFQVTLVEIYIYRSNHKVA